MHTIYAKQDGATALYPLATAPTLGAAFRAARPFRDCSPTGWRTGILHNRDKSLAEPTPDVAEVLAKWQADTAAGVDKNAPAKERERQRYEHRKRLVEEGLYKWSDFDLDADDGYDDDEDDEG
jgi:hypothetical protein